MSDDLRRFALFRNLSSADQDAFAGVMQQRSFPQGVTLFNAGDLGDTVLLIRAGRVRLFMRDETGSEITFRTLGAGQMLGEFSLLDRKPRSFSAVVAEPLDVFVLNRVDFLRLLQERPLVGIELMRGFAERIRYTTAYLERLYDTLDAISRGEFAGALQEVALDADEDEIKALITAFVAHARQTAQAGEKK